MCPTHHEEAWKVAGIRQGKTLRQKLNLCIQACKGRHSPFPTTSSISHLPHEQWRPSLLLQLKIFICFSYFCICLHQVSSFSAEGLCHSFSNICSAQVTLGEPGTAPFQTTRKDRKQLPRKKVFGPSTQKRKKFSQFTG